MALKIKDTNGTIFVEGNINTTTVKQFKNHLEFLLLYSKEVTVNIDNVLALDKNGIMAIKDLFSTALIYNKPFEIIGYGNKTFQEDFQCNKAA